jgi:hypothetical protein
MMPLTLFRANAAIAAVPPPYAFVGLLSWFQDFMYPFAAEQADAAKPFPADTSPLLTLKYGEYPALAVSLQPAPPTPLNDHDIVYVPGSEGVKLAMFAPVSLVAVLAGVPAA